VQEFEVDLRIRIDHIVQEPGGGVERLEQQPQQSA